MSTKRFGFRISDFGFKQRGFTLIELLITVAIIAILISIGSASFLRAQRQSRDAQRKSDLEQVASALEQYYADENTYPESDSNLIDCQDGSGATTITWGNPFTCGPRTYLAELPEDPTATAYTYSSTETDGSACDNTVSDDTCQRFALVACLENTNDQDRDDVDGGANDTCPATGRVSYTVTS